jgi:tripartite-type tricarboxylate transporter receptor subunit TctC
MLGFKANSFERVDLSPQDFGKLIQSDLKHWSALIKAVGAKID